MSNPAAIAAVTETLRSLIAAGGVVGGVTALPPDRAAEPGMRTVNVYLYHIGIDAGLRNQEFPWQGRGGGDSQISPPALAMPLLLHYMITAFADDDVKAQEALGPAMRVLHDHAVLTEAEIRNAAETAGLDSDLHLQRESVKVTMQSLGIDEITKIWTAFQSPFRLSVTYEVSVVLIESARTSSSPLPVLRRGLDDRGVSALAGGGLPIITALTRSDRKLAFNTGFAGDTVRVEGQGFSPDAKVLLRRILAIGELGKLLTPDSVSAGNLTVTLDPVAISAAGPFALCVVVPDPANPPSDGSLDGWWRSNEIGIGIAAKITPPLSVESPSDGLVKITAKVIPDVLPGQHVALLINGRETPATVVTDTHGAPEFTLDSLAPGTYGVRLRVDGVDLPGIVKDSDGLYVFASGEEVVIP